MVEDLKAKKKFYIYDKDKKRIKETYVEKDAKRYEEQGYRVTSRIRSKHFRRIKHD